MMTKYINFNKIPLETKERIHLDKTHPSIELIFDLKQGNKKAINELINKIEVRNKKRKDILKLRRNLPDKDYLINQLRAGRIPEEELHNYFSFWDKP